MGELNSRAEVLAMEERSLVGSAWEASPPTDAAVISEQCFSAAEEVLNCVLPTLDAEEKRRDVVDYIQQLVKTQLNCEVVPYGSVPLKTYLPDGDIDLTILKCPNADESLPHDILSLLEAKEHNEDADYQVKDTQFIDAEVKLVKCLVQNIVMDVTFNQLGGLSALCFLEQVDRFVRRNHLFKHSIILVKAWCYYESRILGAHYGLISTYALETLVLYILHFFHSSLTGPLSVLHRFLDYYSQFDWENYCISLRGPVHKSCLPDIGVKMPENGCDSPLLSDEFLEKSMELFLVPSKLDASPKAFQLKHLNIIDPLKENNNLGRSVHKGNYYRIRSAFIQKKNALHINDEEFLQDYGTRKTRGLGTYFPDMSAFRPSSWRERNNHNHNHHRRYPHSQRLYANLSENGIDARRRSQEHREKCQSPTPRADSCIIEFGSVGNLAEEMLSSSASVQCLKEERIHPKNDDEFPPL